MELCESKGEEYGFENIVHAIYLYPQFITAEEYIQDPSMYVNTAVDSNSRGEDVMNKNELSIIDFSLYGKEKCILPDNKKTTGVVLEKEKVA